MSLSIEDKQTIHQVGKAIQMVATDEPVKRFSVILLDDKGYTFLYANKTGDEYGIGATLKNEYGLDTIIDELNNILNPKLSHL